MKKLHPNIRKLDNHQMVTNSQRDRHIDNINNYNNNYSDGSISFFGVEIDFEWDNQVKSWQCSFPHMVNDEDLVSTLDKLYKVLDASTIASTEQVFSDEAELEYIDFIEKYGRDNSRSPIFYDGEASAWVAARGSKYLAIKVNKVTSGNSEDWILTPEIRSFDHDDVVYFYDDWM